MDVHSINKAIATAMREQLPPGKTLVDGSYLDPESDAVRFIQWAIGRLTPEQAAALVDMVALSAANPIQNSLLLFFPEIMDHATRLSVEQDMSKSRGKRR